MPVYEYSCGKCKHEFEELILGSEQPECPKCGSEKLSKLVSSFDVSDSRRDYTPPCAGMNPNPSPEDCGSCGAQGGPGPCSMN